MDVILPVAGLGTRLRPQTWSKPKPLVSLAGKTILEHVLDRVLPTRPEKIVFVTGYLGSHIEDWARETYRGPDRLRQADGDAGPNGRDHPRARHLAETMR